MIVFVKIAFDNENKSNKPVPPIANPQAFYSGINMSATIPPAIMQSTLSGVFPNKTAA